MVEERIKPIWERIEKWLSSNAPTIVESLQPGATNEEIAATEAFLGVTFPPDIKASYLIHDGQLTDGPGLIDGREFLSLERIKDEWQVWKELYDYGTFNDAKADPEGPIAQYWWNPKWIPITYDGAGNHHCLDLDPAPGGNVGQIIWMWHDNPSRSIEATSFTSWLEAFADELEADVYVYSEEYDGLVNKDDL